MGKKRKLARNAMTRDDAYAQLARVNEWSSPWDEEAIP